MKHPYAVLYVNSDGWVVESILGRQMDFHIADSLVGEMAPRARPGCYFTTHNENQQPIEVGDKVMNDNDISRGPRLVTRRYGSHGHGYILDGEKVPGVTTILNALPKELKQWAADAAANYAIEHWAELEEESLTKRLDKIRYAHKDALTKAATRGTDIHKLAEQLQAGPVDVPEELQGPVEACARFLDDWKIDPIATETPLASTVYRYGGTADLWAIIGARDGAHALIDYKSGKNVYESVVLQLTGYRNADLWQPDGPASEQVKPDVDLVYVAHILPDTVRMLPVLDTGGAQLRQFLYVQQTYEWLQAHGFRGEEPLIGTGERP